MREIEEAYPEAEVQLLWAQDEARLGLKPVMRKVWAPVGERPVARFKRGYKWTYLYGFVRPESGEVFWLILPTVNTELFSMALEEFAREVGAGKDKHIVLVLDKAGWHTGGGVELPEGVHLEFLPSFGLLAGTDAGGEVVAANERGGSQWAVRGDRRDRGGASATLYRTARSARSHPRSHQLPLVAPDVMMSEHSSTGFRINRKRYNSGTHKG